MHMELYRDDFQRIRHLVGAHDFKGVIEALKGRRPVYDDAPPAQRGAYHYAMGNAYSKIGDYKMADYHFDIGLGNVPGSHKIKLEMLGSYLQRGALKDAEALKTELDQDMYLKQSGYRRRFHLLSGQYYKLTGEYRLAHEHYSIAHEMDRREQKQFSHDLKMMEDFMAASNNRKDRTKGIREYANHLSFIDRSANPPTNLSITFLTNCLHAVSREADKIQCLTTLSFISRKFNRLADAIQYNQQALDLDEHHPQSLSARIRLLMEMGNKDEALKRYQQEKHLIMTEPAATMALVLTFKDHGYEAIAASLTKHLLKRNDLGTNLRELAENIRGQLRSAKNNDLQLG